MDLFVTPGMRYFDLYHGVELTPEIEGPLAVLSFEIEGNGYGAILATPGEPNAAIKALLPRMAAMTKQPLASFSHEWKVLPQQIVAIAPTEPAAEAPAGMVRIPGGDFVFKVRGTEIEGGSDNGVDVQYPWEDFAAPLPRTRMQIKPFFIDNIRSPMRSSRNFSTRLTMHPRTKSIFCATGRTARIRRVGTAACDLGFDRGCARLCRLGRQAPAARVGMAVGGPGHRWPLVSVGQYMADSECSRA